MSILSISFRNNQEAFIGKHIAQELEQDGHEASDIRRAVQHAINFYRNTAGFALGKVFDECLARAKKMLVPSRTKRAKKAKTI
ncbi:hypothetical protein [Vibrio hepatarius]|uniref:hypothetical protein n=1 Tax=Vibrio hepatarius TaxID=171383 RepID=UPI001C09A929|nr:hypothetical protein [Vibrio hepatarius]MBU2897713.1 hypothetical protein [Vibrio hepatarius]